MIEAMNEFRYVAKRTKLTNEIRIPKEKLNVSNLATALTGKPVLVPSTRVKRENERYVQYSE